jgi:hypothetical protein
MDYRFLTARIATGSAPEDPGDLGTLAKLGVTHLLDLTVNEEDNGVDAELFTYLHNPAVDDGLPKPKTWFEASTNFALEALSSVAKNVIFIYDKHGVNRGPSTAYTVLRTLGIPAETAADWIHRAIPATFWGMAYNNDAEAALQQMGYAL